MGVKVIGAECGHQFGTDVEACPICVAVPLSKAKLSTWLALLGALFLYAMYFGEVVLNGVFNLVERLTLDIERPTRSIQKRTTAAVNCRRGSPRRCLNAADGRFRLGSLPANRDQVSSSREPGAERATMITA